MAQVIEYAPVATSPDDGLAHDAVLDSAHTLCGEPVATTVFSTANCPECIKMRKSLSVIDGSAS